MNRAQARRGGPVEKISSHGFGNIFFKLDGLIYTVPKKVLYQSKQQFEIDILRFTQYEKTSSINLRSNLK